MSVSKTCSVEIPKWLARSYGNAWLFVLQIHDLQGNIVGTAALSETETKLLSTYSSTEFGVPQSGTTPPKYAWLGALGVSTELAQSSGTSTQGGGSYVPQIARDLQSAPVVPPGAFPNGQGTGSQYGSEIPGWYIKLSEEQSAATLAEYVARQEALRRQAEEEAAGLLAEMELDPHEWAMLTEQQGLAYANGLRSRATSAELAAKFFDLLPRLAKELSATVEGLAAVYNHYAHEVELCALASDRCFVTVRYVTYFGFSFILTVDQEPCFYLGRGYDICPESEDIRRQNEHGRGK